MKCYFVDAFAEKVFEGNTAGVCVLEKSISDEIMQNIAMKNNLSETAFAVRNAMSSDVRNNYGSILNSITDSSGISFASVSFVLAVGQLIYGLIQLVFGIIAAPKGNVFALISGIVLMLSGMLLTPLCKSIISLMLCLGFILPAGTGVPSYGIPSKSGSVVSGIVNASSGIGNTASSPLINSLLRAGGLMYGMLMLAVPTLFMLPVSFLMSRERKRRDSQTVETISQPSSTKAQLNIKAMFGEVFKSKAYIYLNDRFFLDNADIYYQYPTQEIFQALVGVISELEAYRLDIIINGGDVFVSSAILNTTSPLVNITGVNQECVFTSIDFKDGRLKA